ncbi:pseudouridine synthase [Myxozyma melibiosi]|uniref:Pseudouridine synthase n=1 Tax=Myxozyma melibiosi TaxID=54550 RepID=A0ABR1EYD1_9ASCO
MSKRSAEHAEDPLLKRAKTDESDAAPVEDSQTVNGSALDGFGEKGVMETDVGITEYLGSHTGVLGLLKQRYTDFLVNEILTTGKVLHLEHIPVQIEVSKEKKEKKEEGEDSKNGDESKEASKATAAATPKNYVVNAESEAQLREILGEECTLAALEILSSEKNTKTEYTSTKEVTEKATRGKIHQLIRSAYGSLIESSTTAENKFLLRKSGGKSSRVQAGGQRNGGRGDNGMRIDPYVIEHAGDRNQYIEFSIYKVNKETMDVCRLICKYLRKDPKSITIAGTKDRRGVTVQRATMRQIGLDRLVNLNNALKDIALCDFRYTNRMLKLGELMGNEFVITIRDVRLPGSADAADAPVEKVQAAVNQALSSLRDTGFINYFGMQRFGTFSISTHQLGVHILKGDYAKAVRLILCPQDLATEESKAAREQYAKDPEDIDAIVKLMPKHCTAECAVLRGLQRNSTDMLGAIMQIPRNLRLMFVHAYQSYVWNSVVSTRIQKYGVKVLEGDLVIAEDHKDKLDPALTVADADDGFEEDVLQEREAEVRALTKEEVESGLYSIYDIVVPSPGFDVEYPASLLEIYKDIMSRDGLDPKHMYRNVKEFSLSGAYRYMLSKPLSLEWDFRRHDNPLQQLVNTDLEILESKEKGVDCSRVIEQEALGDGSRLGLVVRMKLGTAQYATMALREAMRMETSRRGDMLHVRLQGTAKRDSAEAGAESTPLL